MGKKSTCTEAIIIHILSPGKHLSQLHVKLLQRRSLAAECMIMYILH
jgi:hypothetical protein